MTALRKIKPLPLVGITPAMDLGSKPVMRWVAPTELLVDATYQRDISERSMRLIRRMCEGYRWNRMKPPIVVQADAGLHVIDGQHTAIAAASIGVSQIPVVIVEADAVDERARAFVGHNTDRVTVSQFDLYRALLASGDPDAMDVDNVCKRAGVRLRMISPSSAIAEGDTAALGRVKRLVRDRGVVPARKVLQCLVKAKRAPISAAEIMATERIICEFHPNVDLEELTAVIRIEGTDGLAKAYAKAKTDFAPVWKTLMNRWLRRLNLEPVA